MRDMMDNISTRNILAIMAMLGFFGLVFALLFFPINDLLANHKDVVMTLIVAVTVTFKDVIAYFFGSSKDIEDKK